jgi:hypothetical protein
MDSTGTRLEEPWNAACLDETGGGRSTQWAGRSGLDLIVIVLAYKRRLVDQSKQCDPVKRIVTIELH